MNGQAKTEEAALAAARELVDKVDAALATVTPRTRIWLVTGISYDVINPYHDVIDGLRSCGLIEVVALRMSVDNRTSVPCQREPMAIPVHAIAVVKSIAP